MVPTDAVLSAAAFSFIAHLVHHHSRIRLGTDKQALVAGRLARRLDAVGLRSYDAYCDLLRSPAGDEEIGVLVDLVTTNHTQFFREPAHFAVLADVRGGLFFQPGVRYKPSGEWQFDMYANIAADVGGEGDDMLESFDDMDEVFVRATYYF